MHEIQKLAAQTVGKVLSGSSLNAALDLVWRSNRQLGAPERGAIQDICYGTLRHLGELDAVLAQLAPKPIARYELRNLLLAALYQLEYSKTAPYAVVNGAVESAVQLVGEHVRSFANAVLRNYQRRRDALRAHAQAGDEGRFSYPKWWIDRIRDEFGTDAGRILDIGNDHPPMTLRVNVRRSSSDDYLQQLRRTGIGARQLGNGALLLERPMPVDKLPGFAQGAVSVQDAGAQLAAPLLDIRNELRVLDACSAPGGKSAHILELADVEMVSLDADAVRLQRVGSNIDRLGLRARLQAVDAAALDLWWDGKPFDRVLLDAPCSASGVVRRHPDIKWLRRPSDIGAFVHQQERLLEALWKVVAPGGKLLYATCSLFREENGDVIGKFAERQPDARNLGGMPGRDGLLLPDDEHDGFYYALFQKD